MFSTPWRLERGRLLDLGPHVIDLLDAALGRLQLLIDEAERQILAPR